jgi:hypothetical protein
MKWILDSLKAELITINGDKKRAVRVWHLQVAAFFIGSLIGGAAFAIGWLIAQVAMLAIGWLAS